MKKLLLSASGIALLAGSPVFAELTPADIAAQLEARLNLAEGEVSYDLDTRDDGSVALSNISVGLSDDVVLLQRDGVLVFSAIEGGAYDVEVRGLEHLAYELLDRGEMIGAFSIESDDYSYQMRGSLDEAETSFQTISTRIVGTMVDDLSLHGSFDMTLEDTIISQRSGAGGTMRMEAGRLLSESETIDHDGVVMSRAVSTSDDLIYEIDWSGMPVLERISKFEAGEIPLVQRDDYLVISGISGVSESTQEWQTFDGESIIAQSTGASSEAAIRLEDGALTVQAVSGSASVKLAGSMLPFSKASLSIDGLDTTVTFPMIADGRVSNGAFSFSVDGVSASDGIWDSFDPAGTLSRDPASIAIDVGFGVGLPEGLFVRSQGMALREPPTIENLDINEVSISAAGVDLSLDGRVQFDNSNRQPTPVGAVDAEISGINGFMEALSEMGVLPAEMLMGARMMMGVMLLPTDVVDQYTSHIEMNANGEITANGVPLQ
ncbi:hypothetical protein SAMN06273572_104206 [Monaibacterium marinum]|uniref:DUF2125 domain-containing protein n=1 Tax=Pontivivens marinum TaxID=1690039 RepID=A0A2C9CTB7_9RHOB|nr:hypothetical protein [Monaibacterium marinum]SOH94507.1 hypothetical protein SAMN06273572_104206 [Monaibacterium marinum]